jgi:hypothetical protein
MRQFTAAWDRFSALILPAQLFREGSSDFAVALLGFVLAAM